MAMRSIEGQNDVWCVGEYNAGFFYFIISGWIPTQNILSIRSSLKRRNKTANTQVYLVWRLVKETSEDPSWAATPDDITITTTDASFTDFVSATTAIAEYRFCQFALKVYNLSGTNSLNFAQIEHSIEFRNA